MQAGRTETLEWLLENTEARGEILPLANRKSLLHHAAKFGQVCGVTSLLHRAAKFGQVCGVTSLLHRAAKFGHVCGVTSLLHNAAKFGQVCGVTSLLHHASKFGQVCGVTSLLYARPSLKCAAPAVLSQFEVMRMTYFDRRAV